MATTSKTTRSPLAPEEFPQLPDVAGVRIATAMSGIKYQGRDDLLLVEMAAGTTVAGVFTQSQTCSAPVDWCKRTLKGGTGEAQALIVNAGNANAFTGSNGEQSVTRIVEAVADHASCRPSRVYTASTGVIGEDLPHDKITDQLDELYDTLAPDQWQAAALAILTTDTFAKAAGLVTTIAGQQVSIVGIAKGSGMIAPDMATMLSFVFTDANIPATVLQEMISDIASKTFNCITVDSDTSTSDTLLAFATGAGNQHQSVERADDPALEQFRQAMFEVCCDLSHQVVRDGEGATKFITVTLSGAEDDGAARLIALAIANSPLVKTAIAGEDANWGRIVMAVGKAGQRADRDKISISIGGYDVASNGRAVPNYDETPVAEHMKTQAIDIAVDVGVGQGTATVWSCDLTHGYITINADYRS